MFRREFLLTPGPTPIPESVLLKQAEMMIHHRTPQYSEVFSSCLNGLKSLLLTENPILLFASSGTGAMESAVANCFKRGEKVLVAVGGKFAERFVEICKMYGLEVIEYEYDWSENLDPSFIEKTVREDSAIKGVFITHSETSTGIVNDVEAVGRIVAESEALLIVDSVSGAGALEMRTDDWCVDVLCFGSQKALMVPPGLSGVSLSKKAAGKIEECDLPSYYFNYKAALKALDGKDPQTPYTPAISLVKALDAACMLLLQEGIENVWARHELLAMSVRAAVEEMGLSFYPKSPERAFAVTAVNVPEGVDGEALVKNLNRKYGVIIAGGQSQLKGKIFRIGHVGYYHPFDMIIAVSALEMALNDAGFRVEPGKGTGAASRVLKDAFK